MYFQYSYSLVIVCSGHFCSWSKVRAQNNIGFIWLMLEQYQQSEEDTQHCRVPYTCTTGQMAAAVHTDDNTPMTVTKQTACWCLVFDACHKHSSPSCLRVALGDSTALSETMTVQQALITWSMLHGCSSGSLCLVLPCRLGRVYVLVIM